MVVLMYMEPLVTGQYDVEASVLVMLLLRSDHDNVPVVFDMDFTDNATVGNSGLYLYMGCYPLQVNFRTIPRFISIRLGFWKRKRVR